MKLQIIQLESEDDHITVRDKLATAKAERVILVWPFRGRILTRRLDIQLIDRAAKQRGIQLGLLTFDPDVLQHAQAVAVPVFDSLEAVPENNWPAPVFHRPGRRSSADRKSRSRPREVEGKTLQPAVRMGVFTVAILALITAIVLIYPHADIALLPDLHKQTIQFNFRLNPDLERAGNTTEIPARRIEVEVQGEQRLAASGSISVPTVRATGKALITNLTEEEIIVPAGTGVRAAAQPELRFSTTEKATIPPEQETEVPIIAIDPGSGSNLPAGSVDTVDGALGLSIRVINPDPTSGGANQLRSAVTNQDIEDLETALTMRLLEEAQVMLNAQLNSNEQLSADSLLVSEVLESRYDAARGDSTETLGFSATLLVSGLAYKLADVGNLAASALLDALAPDQGARPGTLAVESIEETAASGSAMLTVVASQSTFDLIDVEELKRRVRGKSVEDAIVTLVEEHDLAASPAVVTSPGWFKRLPWLTMRIDMRWVWEARN